MVGLLDSSTADARPLTDEKSRAGARPLLCTIFADLKPDNRIRAALNVDGVNEADAL